MKSARTNLIIGGACIVIGVYQLYIILNKKKSKKSSIGSPHPALKSAIYSKCSYLDYNASTPIFPEVCQLMNECSTMCFGNPSSSHVFGVRCKEVMNTARKQVMDFINSPSPENIVFVSSGSEADNRAIDMALNYFSQVNQTTSTPEIVTIAIEHPAILKYLKHLQKLSKIKLVVLPVDYQGFVAPNDIHKALNQNTALVTVMHANNEIGTIQPLSEISAIIKKFNAENNFRVLFHTDAAQSLGKIPLDVQALSLDLVTIVGHKFGASKGVGALYINPDIRYDR